MRVGVIGLAGVGKTHLKTWLQIAGVELVAVCDVVEESAHAIGSLYDVASFTDAEQMLDPNVSRLDAVSICTPPKSHLPLTQLAAERGVNVLCEKPMANCVEQCQAMIDVCDERGVTLMIGHKQRFTMALMRLRELTREFSGHDNGGAESALDKSVGELGAIKFILMRYPHPWFSEKDWYWREDDGGGPLLENMVHATDVLQFLCGDVERVYAEGAHHFAEKYAPAFNCAAITLRFASGAVGTLGAGFVSHQGFTLEDFFVATDDGVATVSGDFDNPDTLRWAMRNSPTHINEEVSPCDTFRAEMEHFVSCVKNGKRPRASGADGLKAVAVCRAAIQSARNGQPVTIRAKATNRIA